MSLFNRIFKIADHCFLNFVSPKKWRNSESRKPVQVPCASMLISCSFSIGASWIEGVWGIALIALNSSKPGALAAVCENPKGKAKSPLNSLPENVWRPLIVSLDIHRKAAFCRFGEEISFRLKIRGCRNTPCISAFPKCTAGTKDPSKTQRGSFSEVANYIRGKPQKIIQKVEQLHII